MCEDSSDLARPGKSSCEVSSHSGGRGKSPCEDSSDLARPGESSCEVSSHLEKMYLVIEHNHQSFEQLGTCSRDIGSRKSEHLVAGSTIFRAIPETSETRPMSYLRPSLRIVRIIRHRSEAGEEQRPVCWASGTLWTEGKETCIKAPYLEGTIHLSETPSTMRLLRWTPLSFCSKEAPESQGPGHAWISTVYSHEG